MMKWWGFANKRAFLPILIAGNGCEKNVSATKAEKSIFLLN
jgi:hypothetical protein